MPKNKTTYSLGESLQFYLEQLKQNKPVPTIDLISQSTPNARRPSSFACSHMSRCPSRCAHTRPPIGLSVC